MKNKIVKNKCDKELCFKIKKKGKVLDKNIQNKGAREGKQACESSVWVFSESELRLLAIFSEDKMNSEYNPEISSSERAFTQAFSFFVL